MCLEILRQCKWRDARPQLVENHARTEHITCWQREAPKAFGCYMEQRASRSSGPCDGGDRSSQTKITYLQRQTTHGDQQNIRWFEVTMDYRRLLVVCAAHCVYWILYIIDRN